MKFTRSGKGQWVVHLDKREASVFKALLRRYPVIPSAHRLHGKHGPGASDENSQRLLDESLADQRRESKSQIARFLKDTRRFTENAGGAQVTLSSADIEWLLQILNDIRVGSWIALGSPETQLWELESDEARAPIAWTMELAGHFQMFFLEVISRGDSA